MINFNFIKGEFNKEYIEENKKNFIFKIIMLILYALIILTLSNFFLQLYIEKDIRKLNNEIVKLEERAKHIDELKIRNVNLINKINFLIVHFNNDLNCLNLINYITNKNLSGLWVEELKLIQGDIEQEHIYNIELYGYSIDLNILTEFLKEIKESGQFEQVDLIDSYQHNINKEKLTRFNIKLRKNYQYE
jgi:hypothetical protein